MKAIEHVKQSVLLGNFRSTYITEEDALKAVGIAYQEAVAKWTRWCFNYDTPFEKVICKIWGGTLTVMKGEYWCNDNTLVQHLIMKWHRYEGNHGAMINFYSELDEESRKKLVNYVFSK